MVLTPNEVRKILDAFLEVSIKLDEIQETFKKIVDLMDPEIGGEEIE
jgi:hypothetical protein